MEAHRESISLVKLIDDFSLEKIYVPDNLEAIMINCSDVYRPGIPLSAGYFDYFDADRIQVLGKMEQFYMIEKTPEERFVAYDRLMSRGIPAVILPRSLESYPELQEPAKIHRVPLLRTSESTSGFIAALIGALNVYLAPTITRHGVLVEVYGEGVLLLGDSGVGKSETAIELIKRGHRLVADDAVEIRRTSAKTVVGSSPEIIRHFMELRGIGIVDVKRIFGVGAVKDTEKINLVVNLEVWQQGKNYERLGLDREHTTILGIALPSVTIPVRPGRNLAVIIEIAAMNNRQQRMGYNAAAELSDRLNTLMAAQNQNITGGDLF